MNIQEAIKSGKPFRRKGWVDDNIFVIYEEGNIVLAIESDPSTSIELDVQDILALDWYLRDESLVRFVCTFNFNDEALVEGKEIR